MTEARAVNIRNETADVYCGRGTRLGNRFGGRGRSRNTAILNYIHDFYHRVETEPGFVEYLRSLRGKRLGCHCKPMPCHVDCVVKWINEDAASDRPPQAP